MIGEGALAEFEPLQVAEVAHPVVGGRLQLAPTARPGFYVVELAVVDPNQKKGKQRATRTGYAHAGLHGFAAIILSTVPLVIG